jgi:hypothetical protein
MRLININKLTYRDSLTSLELNQILRLNVSSCCPGAAGEIRYS